MDIAASLGVARLGLVDYAAALELQNAAVAARLGDTIGDTLILLEHPHVYTLGRGADPRYIISAPEGVPIHRVSRGGQVTYHGPGQLIGYAFVKLIGSRRSVSGYLRTLEQTLTATLREFGIEVPEGIARCKAVAREALEIADNGIAEVIRPFIAQILQEIEAQQDMMDTVERSLIELTQEDEVVQRQMKNPGVGLMTATAYGRAW